MAGPFCGKRVAYEVVIILIISASSERVYNHTYGLDTFAFHWERDPSPLKYSKIMLSFLPEVLGWSVQPVPLAISSNIQPFLFGWTDFMTAISKYLPFPDKLLVNKCILMRTKNSSRKWKNEGKESELTLLWRLDFPFWPICGMCLACVRVWVAAIGMNVAQ